MGARPHAGAEPVTLDNCDREPIHIPGAIQSHGALLAFGADGALRWASDGAEAVLGTRLPELGSMPAATDFDAEGSVLSALRSVRDRGADGAGIVDRHQVRFAGRAFDLLVHHNGRAVVAEFEGGSAGGREDRADFTALAYASMARLRQQRTLQGLLETAVVELRALTGFDRVMAYRFRHDASGDVVAEARREDLEPFLHRRYPASDIPAQARRLYVLNTVRLIADIGSRPVALRTHEKDPLDLSWASLRSVSPMHIEYLGNMGVAASMSVSIVIDGQLWGMLACHHMAPKAVPDAVRTAADVLGQLLASSVQTLLSAERAAHLARGSELRVRIIETVMHEDDTLDALKPFAAELCALLGADALVATEDTGAVVHGCVDADSAGDLVRWLRTLELRSGLLAASALADLPPDLAVQLQPLAGLLALRIDEEGSSWLVLLRREQIELVDWGGRPEKHYVPGPNGPRLTPRGSFDVWRETVRGTTLPWTQTEQDLAQALRGELLRASAARHARLARARDQMFAVLGHDLRNPLQTIAMASQLLERGGDSRKIGQRISRSSSQMARLITHVLDVARLQGGVGLGVKPVDGDLSALLQDMVKDSRVAYPLVDVVLDAPASLVLPIDADRMAQLVDNLLGNARQHGEPGHPIVVRLHREGGVVELSVANHGAPIPAEVARDLYTPFKRTSVGNPNNRGGLGLGLSIASEIARAHGGTLAYEYVAPRVVFACRLPGHPA